MCWHARTIDADGDIGEWTDAWSYTVPEIPDSITISVESPQIDAGQATSGSTVLTQFNVSVDGRARLYVNDSSDTIAATCSCGETLLDVPLGSDPDWWTAGAYPGHAGLTVLDTKGRYDGEGGYDDDWRDDWRWGDAPASGADLHDIDASKWVAVPGPTTPLFLAFSWPQVDVRLGYRMGFGASPRAGTYSTDLVFTAIPGLGA
jgi:hypothetical protein